MITGLIPVASLPNVGMGVLTKKGLLAVIL